MRKGKSLIGMRVISEMDGSALGQIKDLVFDHDANQVLALLMSERDLFGLIDAQIIPWEQVTHIGPDAVTVMSSDSRIKAGSDPRVAGIMHRETALSGTRIFTTDGRNLGTLADTYINEKTGDIEGYEISGGFVADTMSGKKFLPAEYELTVGRDVALVPPAAAQGLKPQGGVQAAAQSAQSAVQDAADNTSQSIFQVYETAREKAGSAYENITNASVEKQKVWVIGKKAAHDVIVPAVSRSTPGATAAPTGSLSSDEIETPGTSSVAADITSSGEVVSGEVLVREGETILASHAERAVSAGVLGRLVAAAVSGTASEAYTTSREKISSAVAAGDSGKQWQEQLHSKAEAAVLGKPAARDVVAADGTRILAAGETVTPEVMELARRYDREKEVMTSAGLGGLSQTAQTVGEELSHAATSLWEAARQKVNEWSHTLQERQAEAESQELQERIKEALGRPVTRVILDEQDNAILRTGEIVTHAAVDSAREAGVLDILLESVSTAPANIAPSSTVQPSAPENTPGANDGAPVIGDRSTSITHTSMADESTPVMDAAAAIEASSAAPVRIEPDGTKTYVLDETPAEAAERESSAVEDDFSPSTSLIADESRSNDSALEAQMLPLGRSLPR